jgi:hypothetical protein
MVKFKSFSEVVEGEPERLVAYAFKENPDIKNFAEFDDAFRKAFNSPLGENAKIDAQDIVRLFESKPCKEQITKNVSPKELEGLYGDGVAVQREAVSPTKVITITFKKIPIKSHTRNGNPIKNYSKGYRKWNSKELHFLKIQKQKNLSTKKIFSNYNSRFKDTPRTESSLKTKIYRT